MSTPSSNRLLETVVPLAASVDDYLAYSHADGGDIDEPVKVFLNEGLDVVERIAAAGLLSGDLPELLDDLERQGIAAVNAAP